MNYCKFDYQKLEVVKNGFDHNLYKKITPSEKVDKALEDIGIEKPYIFYIGRLEKKKNTPALIEAYAFLKEKHKDIKHKLLLVGNASYGYDETKYMIREFDLVDDVIIPGWLEEDIIPYLYNGASLFVFPSKYEGFGIPILEAMACGTPVIASNSSSIPEVAGKAAQYFNPDFSLSIAEVMYKTLTNDELRKTMIDSGFKQAAKFSWEKCAKSTLDIISK